MSRTQLRQLLGDLPPHPLAPVATARGQSEAPDYRRLDLLLDNAHDAQIPAILLLPKRAQPPFPAVMYLHAHGNHYAIGKSEMFQPRAGDFIPAVEFTRQGYAVFIIDAYAFEERQTPDEMTLFKQFLWEGRSLWGMMLRDDLLALDYLTQHPQIDANRIAAVGMSMGSTRAWWLAALDERITVTVAVACMTRYADLIAAGGLPEHSIYFYVPGILKHFDTEAIFSLIAPRPLLCLTGDSDPTSPVNGVRKIADHLDAVYADLGYPAQFRNVIYPDTAHAFTVEMWHEMMAWLVQHL